MRKISLLYCAAIALLMSLVFDSCKKTQHPTNPLPGNSRMQAYTKITTIAGATTNDNYRFFYNSNGTVSQILYTTNDSFAKDQSMVFAYSGDSIFKTVTLVKTSTILEVDTFIKNSSGLITTAYMKNFMYNFEYFGRLLARETKVARGDSGTSISGFRTYTSNNSDFLLRSFNGTLTANFADSGLQLNGYPHDTDIVFPLTVTWVSYAKFPYTVYTHSGVTSYTDVLNGYADGGPLSVTAVDAMGAIVRDTTIYPQDLAEKQSYGIWPDLLNRTGDYLQLESFTTFGVNVFQNTHLVKSITSNVSTANITYDIDADSKISQTFVSIVYPAGYTNTIVYKLQYETF